MQSTEKIIIQIKRWQHKQLHFLSYYGKEKIMNVTYVLEFPTKEGILRKKK